MASDTVASQKDGRTSTVQLLSKIPGQRTRGREQLCLTRRGQLPGVDSMLERHFQLSGCPSGLAWWRASSHSTECCLNPNTALVHAEIVIASPVGLNKEGALRAQWYKSLLVLPRPRQHCNVPPVGQRG